MSQDIYTWDDMPGFIHKVASHIGYRYRRHVEYDDVSQELYAWLYGKGRKKVIRWLDAEPQQLVRIYYELTDQALRYAEKEKALQVGYKPDDVWWYSASTVENLMPHVLDDEFIQANGHVGELITMVIDIRKAVEEAGLTEFFGRSDESHPDWQANVQLVLDRLGGERPSIGRRKVLSNAQAIAITGALTE